MDDEDETKDITMRALDQLGDEAAPEDVEEDKWSERPIQSAFNALGGGFLAAAGRRAPR